MKTIHYLLAVVLIFGTGTATAQPGWQDLTQHYNYTIADESGKEIAFKADRNYTVRVDSVSYSGASIPFDSLKPATPNIHHFDNYIRINDLSLRVPQNNRHVPLEIAIIRGRDTMHLDQPVSEGHRILGRDHHSRSLRYIPGHYYFPRWATAVFDNGPTVGGNVTVRNAEQRSFIIPGALYREFSTNYKERQLIERRKEDRVVANFTEGYITVTRDEAPINTKGRVDPYTKSWGHTQLFPTTNSDVHTGIIQYKFDTINASLSKGVFAVFNKKENTISHWLPRGNMHAFSTAYLYRDTFNGVLYNATLFREMAPPCTLLRNDCPFTLKYFRSDDEGRSWREDGKLKKLFDTYKLRQLEFIDERHALGFTLTEKDKGKRSRYQQGTYYLIKDMKVADSLVTPPKVHYNSNHTHYSFSREGDTIRLGQWGSVDGDSKYGDPLYRPFIVGHGGRWKFSVKEDVYKRPKPRVETPVVKEYVNFTLHENKLAFRNGTGTLELTKEVVDEPLGYGIYVLEKGSHIYLLDNADEVMMVSFDGGTAWYVYPQSLSDRSNCSLLGIDDDRVISFFDLFQMKKVSYKFSAAAP